MTSDPTAEIDSRQVALTTGNKTWARGLDAKEPHAQTRYRATDR